MDERCKHAFDDFIARKAEFETQSMSEISISSDCRIFRLVKRLDKKDPDKPDPTCFTEKGLSCVVIGPSFPFVDLDDGAFIAAWRSKGYLGLWEIPIGLFLNGDFEIRHDPFPYRTEAESLEEQGPNHAQIFCHKSQSTGRAAVGGGSWRLRPDT